jgi:hypothetical protein
MLRTQPLLRLLLINAAGGALIGLLFALALVALDAAQLQTLIRRDPSGGVALVLLLASFAITVGGLSAATAVMSRESYGADEAGPPRGR